MNQYLVSLARKGECAIFNNGTVEQLNEVLQACWPGCATAEGGWPIYTKYSNGSFWNCIEKTSLPAHSVTEFLKDEFVYGEEVMTPAGDHCLYIGKSVINPKSYVVETPTGLVYQTKVITRLPPPLTLSISEAEKMLTEVKGREVKIEVK